MLKFACKDAGVDCDYVATGETVEAVKENAFSMRASSMRSSWKSMSQEQLTELTRSLRRKSNPQQEAKRADTRCLLGDGGVFRLRICSSLFDLPPLQPAAGRVSAATRFWFDWPARARNP